MIVNWRQPPEIPLRPLSAAHPEDRRCAGDCGGWSRGRHRKCNLHSKRSRVAAAHGLGDGATRRVSAFPAELERAIRDYLSVNNRDPKPFVWTKTADQILESITRFCIGLGNHRVFPRRHSVDTRLIRCWYVSQWTPITEAALVLIDDSPEVVGAFRAYLLLGVTEVHVGYVYTESA
jgi:hypothetical protein